MKQKKRSSMTGEGEIKGAVHVSLMPWRTKEDSDKDAAEGSCSSLMNDTPQQR